MADWLERAKREFAQTAERVTAEAAERNPTVVTAVPGLVESDFSLESIGSNGSDATADFRETESVGDDRNTCVQCANLTVLGLCLAARRGEIVASPYYEPIRDLPRRCEGYIPGVNDSGLRSSRER